MHRRETSLEVGILPRLPPSQLVVGRYSRDDVGTARLTLTAAASSGAGASCCFSILPVDINAPLQANIFQSGNVLANIEKKMVLVVVIGDKNQCCHQGTSPRDRGSRPRDRGQGSKAVK